MSSTSLIRSAAPNAALPLVNPTFAQPKSLKKCIANAKGQKDEELSLSMLGLCLDALDGVPGVPKLGDLLGKGNKPREVHVRKVKKPAKVASSGGKGPATFRLGHKTAAGKKREAAAERRDLENRSGAVRGAVPRLGGLALLGLVLGGLFLG